MTINATELLKDGVMTPSDAADFSGMCIASIYNAINDGSLPSVRIPGRRARRIPKRAMVEYLAQGLGAPMEKIAVKKKEVVSE